MRIPLQYRCSQLNLLDAIGAECTAFHAPLADCWTAGVCCMVQSLKPEPPVLYYTNRDHGYLFDSSRATHARKLPSSSLHIPAAVRTCHASALIIRYANTYIEAATAHVHIRMKFHDAWKATRYWIWMHTFECHINVTICQLSVLNLNIENVCLAPVLIATNEIILMEFKCPYGIVFQVQCMQLCLCAFCLLQGGSVCAKMCEGTAQVENNCRTHAEARPKFRSYDMKNKNVIIFHRQWSPLMRSCGEFIVIK